MQRAFNSIFSSTLPLATLSCLIPLAAQGQIIPDNSLGEESSVVIPFDEQGVAADVIDGGAARGANLFHSFQEFNVSPDRGAFFSNPEGINNIFSRVTGTNISNINGTLGVLGSANLFLINPNGIAFGENAAFSIQGSFYASTADSLLLEGDTEFSAVNPQAPPLLEVNIPIGLSFRDNPRDVTYNSAALIPEGQTFALVGGNVDLNSNTFIFTSLDSRLELGGLAAAGDIRINENGSLVFPDDTARGNVTFNGSSIGIDLISPSERGGAIAINARNVSFNPGSEFDNPTSINLGIPAGADASESQAGDFVINATETVSLNGGSVVSQNNFGIGDTGKIEITARNISFTNAGNISNFNGGQGNSGEVSLNAVEDIIFDGVNPLNRSGIDSTVFVGGEGNSSNINLTASNLSIINGGSISSQVSATGDSGKIDLNISDSTIIDGVGEQVLSDGTASSASSRISSNVAFGGVGNSGDINLNTTSLSLSNTGQISAISGGEGNAGNIFIDANNIFLSGSGEITAIAIADGNGGNITIDADNININGKDDINPFSSGIRSDFLGTAQMGNAGDITISTESLSLIDGGQIESITNANGNAGNIFIDASDEVLIAGENDEGSRSNIDAQVLPTAVGNGGNIDISAAKFSLTNNAVITNSVSGRGNAGSINIDATNTFVADNSSIVSNVGDPTDVVASGNVGNIEITAREITFTNTAQIQAGLFSNATGNSGTVILNAQEFISFAGENTGIFTNNEVDSIGDASNARLFAPTITFDNGAGVEATNFGQGNGGNVTIVADNLTLDRNNSISGSTVSGTGGIVNLQIAEDLILRSGNEISAQAFNDADGGNLTIDSELIIAFDGNNDIIASAERGNGGNININAESLFGIAERPLNPFTNDINASSEFGLQGNIDINNPAVDPTTGLINLPTSVGNASDQISQNPCQQGIGSEFIVTGKGGLPRNPAETLNSDRISVDLVEPLLREEEETRRQGEKEIVREAVPAMGWVFNDKGEVTLTAHSNTNTERARLPFGYASRSPQHRTACQSNLAP